MSLQQHLSKGKSLVSFLFTGIFLCASCSSDEIKEITETYPDGAPRIIQFYRTEGNDTIRTGEQILYQNGQIQLEGSFARDTLFHGIWTIRNENGEKNAEAVFDQGLLQGEWNVWDLEGGEISKDLVQIEKGEDGFPLLIRLFTSDGESRRITGEIHFYSNHLKKTEGPVEGDQKHGLWKAWYWDGTKWSEGMFQHDVNHGRHTVWHENGSKFYEGEYVVGRRTGIWYFWNENGRLVKELNYSELYNQDPLRD